MTTNTQSVSADEVYAKAPVGTRILISVFIFVPLLAVVVALPIALSGVLPLTWLDLVLGVTFYAVAALGITIGYHRLFTHGSFKVGPITRWLLAFAGGLAIQGKLEDWVADHRKHHAFSDEVGDPHSPWRFGTSHRAVAKGLWWAHTGWLVDARYNRDIEKYAPDIRRDPVTRSANRWFGACVAISILGPAVIGGLVTWSWFGALSAFFWAGLVRIALVHHITWSINSICHVFGKRPFKARDLSTNNAWIALPSFGESWHNYHHSDPTAARHGVLANQWDASARLIWTLEKLGLAHDVRWPTSERVAAKLKDPDEDNPQREVKLSRQLN